MKKLSGFMKFIGVAFCFLLVANGSFGQKALPVYDGINYSTGALVFDNINWWCLNATPVNDALVNSGSLSYSGLTESTGNKVTISGSGDEIVIWFGDRPADTKIFYSYIFQVTDMTGISSGTPAHVAGFSNSATTTSSFGCSIFVQKDATDQTKFNIGHSTRSSVVPVWNNVSEVPVKYSFNTPVFIVGCYEIIGTFVDGTPNDKSSLWINPSGSTFEETIPPTASLTGDLTGGAPNDINPVNRFYIRQDAATNTPSVDFDEIRIGLTWAAVTPKSIPTGTDEDLFQENNQSIYPNPVKDILNIDIKNPGINRIEIYNIMGNRIITERVGIGKTVIDISSLSKGIYLISFKGSGIAFNKQFIKD